LKPFFGAILKQHNWNFLRNEIETRIKQISELPQIPKKNNFSSKVWKRKLNLKNLYFKVSSSFRGFSILLQKERNLKKSS
jgi:hypothetical protein